MDISKDKQAVLHAIKLGRSKEKETLKEKQNLS